MKFTPQKSLSTDLPWVASRGLKSVDDGMAAKSLDDVMEQTGPNDPDAVGASTNRPAAVAHSGADANPARECGKGQYDD